MSEPDLPDWDVAALRLIHDVSDTNLYSRAHQELRYRFVRACASKAAAALEIALSSDEDFVEQTCVATAWLRAAEHEISHKLIEAPKRGSLGSYRPQGPAT